MRRAKTAEPIEMPFALWTLVGPRNHILDGGPDPLCEGAVLKGERGGPLCTDQDAIWSVDSGGPEEVCVIWGAYWHYVANTTGPSMCGGDAAFVSNSWLVLVVHVDKLALPLF